MTSPQPRRRSPRGTRRQGVTLRLDQAVIDALDQRAEAENLRTDHGDPNRSELIRIMIAYAAGRMPAGWRPPT